MRKIVIIGLGVGLVLGIGAGGYFLYQNLRGEEGELEGDQLAQEGEGGFRGLQPAGEADRPVENPDADNDADGLNNEEEGIWKTDPANPDTDGDGYLDGEEVAANHDPTKPAPDDRLTALPETVTGADGSPVQAESYLVEDLNMGLGDENFTEQYEGEYSAELQSPSTMTQYSGEKPIITLLPKPEDSEITNPYEDSSAAMAKYLSVADNTAVLADSAAYNEAQQDLQADNDTSGVLGISKNFREYREKLIEAPVPESAVELQKLLLGYSAAIVATTDQIALWPEDPVKSMAASRQLYVLDRTYFPIIGREIQRLRLLEAQLAAQGL